MNPRRRFVQQSPGEVIDAPKLEAILYPQSQLRIENGLRISVREGVDARGTDKLRASSVSVYYVVFSCLIAHSRRTI